MYSESVSEIIDDLMFDERYPDRECMKREGLRRLLEKHLKEASGRHKNYCRPDIPEKMILTIRKYYDADAKDEDIIGFYDNTMFGDWTDGILFSPEGLFIREHFPLILTTSPYIYSFPMHIPYQQIMSKKIEPTKKRLVLPLSGNVKKKLAMNCNKKKMGEMIQQIVELYKRMEERKNKVKEHE